MRKSKKPFSSTETNQALKIMKEMEAAAAAFRKNAGYRFGDPIFIRPPTDGRFPFRWTIEVRRSTKKDVERFGNRPYPPSCYQGGVATHFAEEILAARSIKFSDLAKHLRALADHYDQIKGCEGDDAVVLIGRRTSDYGDE